MWSLELADLQPGFVQGRERSVQIRQWAKQRGYKINELRRTPVDVVAGVAAIRHHLRASAVGVGRAQTRHGVHEQADQTRKTDLYRIPELPGQPGYGPHCRLGGPAGVAAITHHPSGLRPWPRAQCANPRVGGAADTRSMSAARIPGNVVAEYEGLVPSYDEGVAEFLDLER
jgi:hypothetical protein